MRTINTNDKVKHIIENMRKSFQKYVGELTNEDEKKARKLMKKMFNKIWRQNEAEILKDAPKLRK